MAVNVESFYRRYAPMVLRRCRAMLGDEESALDAMQDVFVQVLRRRDTLEDRGASSLLYTIATNVCLNRLRGNRRRREDANEELVGVAAAGDRQEDQVLTRHFLERLFSEQDEQSRTIAYVHYVEGYTLAETAEAVGMSVSGIRKRLRKLRSLGLELKEI